jgi:hypothetical protein
MLFLYVFYHFVELSLHKISVVKSKYDSVIIAQARMLELVYQLWCSLDDQEINSFPGRYMKFLSRYAQNWL